MVQSSIVRLGPSDNDDAVTSKLLRTAIVSYFDKQQQEEASETTTIDDKTASKITISNKYFTADVLLEDIGGGSSAVEEQTTTTKEDGIVLVFDALRSNPDLSGEVGGAFATFDSLALAHRQAESKYSCGDLLRLCVGISLTSGLSAQELRGKDHEKEYARRILWCLDNGYEYIECDLSEEGLCKGHNDRDKEGFARIVEAIQGTVWSSAVMIKSKTQQLKSSYAQDLSALRSNEVVATEKKTAEEKEEENPYQPPDPKNIGIVSSKTEKNDKASSLNYSKKEEEENSNTNVIDNILDPSKVGTEEMSKLRKDLETEQIFEQMESTLKEANRIRELSVNGQMNDDERRARAGDAAMALVNLMGDLGFDDDDDASVVDVSDNDSGIAE